MNFGKKHFRELADVLTTDKPCVSLFLPTRRAGYALEERLRFKNMLAETVTKLASPDLATGVLQPAEVDELLKPAYDLLDDNDFWLHLSDGIGVFLGPTGFKVFVVPVEFVPLVYVSNHYYLRHLLPLISDVDKFLLLTLSRNRVQLFRGNKKGLVPVELGDSVPEGMEEAVAGEVVHKGLSWHSGVNRQGGTKPGAAIFHGHGAPKDHEEVDLETYLRMVDDGLMQMLHGEQTPMLIYAAEEIPPLYRKISKYRNILDLSIEGNPDYDNVSLLHEKAWATMKEHFDAALDPLRQAFGDYEAHGKGSFSIHDVATAAINGRVDTLFVDQMADVIWGFYNEADNSVTVQKEQQPYSTCLLNLAVMQVYRNNGIVYVLDRMEMPESRSPINALYRY